MARLDPAVADVRELAEALRRECETTLDPKALNNLRYPREYQFAAALLAVNLGELSTGRMRRVAAAYVAAGGILTGGE